MEESSKRLGDILLKYELITKEQLQEALELQKSESSRLGEILIKKDFITEDDLFWALSNKFDIPYIDLEESMVDIKLFSLFSDEFLTETHFLPLVKFGDELTVCVVDPTNNELQNKIAEITHCTLNVSLCSYSDMENVREKVLAKWKGQELSYERVLSNFFEPISESTVNSLLKDDSMTTLILYIFDEMVKTHSNSVNLIKDEREIRVFFTFKGLRTLKFKISPVFWKPIMVKLEELQKISDTERIMISRSVSYYFEYFQISKETVNIKRIYTVNRVSERENLSLTKEQSIIVDNIIPFKRGLCVFSSKDKGLTRKIAYNILNYDSADHTVVVKLDRDIVLEGFDNIINIEDKKVLKDFTDFDILIVDEKLISLRDISYLLEQGKLIFLLSHTYTSAEFMEYLYTDEELFIRIIPNLKLMITSVVVPTLCEKCREEVNFSMIPKDIFSFYKDMKFFKANGCNECFNSGYNGFKELNELLYVDSNVRGMLKEKIPSEDIFKSLKSTGYVGIREKLLELAKNGDIPYHYLI